jgi:hypothetical protein
MNVADFVRRQARRRLGMPFREKTLVGRMLSGAAASRGETSGACVACCPTVQAFAPMVASSTDRRLAKVRSRVWPCVEDVVLAKKLCECTIDELRAIEQHLAEQAIDVTPETERVSADEH